MVTRKKILIVENNLATGGIQRSLINLLNEIKDIFDVTLFVFSNHGEYKDSIPSQVRVIEASPLLRLLGISQIQSKEMGSRYYFLRAVLAFYSRILGNHLPIRLLVSTQGKLSGFDAAISFVHSSDEKLLYGGCNEFVLYRVITKTKIAFLHCDFANYGGNTRRTRKLYKLFDRIAAVSEGCRESFIKSIPDLAEKTKYVYNCYNYSDIMDKAADNPADYPEGSLNLITAARLSKEKGFLTGIDIISKLVGEGYHILWHILGEGPQRKELETKIRQTDSSDYILLYGNQENPYRFMKNADLLLLPSLHEAAPMVFGEAKCLGLPVLTTRTTSAEEMVLEGKEGFICENNKSAIYLTLKGLLENPKQIKKCREFLKNKQYTNNQALSQFYSLLEERN